MNQELLQLLNALKTAEGLSLGAIAKEVKDLKDDQENVKKDLEKVLLQIVDKVDSIPLNEEIGKVNDKLRNEVAKLTENFDKKTEKQIKSIENKIKTLATELRIEIESKIPETIRETIIEKVNEVKIDEKPEDIAKKLNTLDSAIDAKVIKGLEDSIDASKIKNLKDLLPKNPPMYGGGSGASFLKSLRDVNLTGLTKDSEGKYLLGSGSGGSSTFLDLTDTPSSYASQALKVVRVNAGETGLEFVTLAGGGDALTSDPLSQFASTTSAQLAGVISDETGTGALVFGTDPTFTTRINVPEIKATGAGGIDIHNSAGTQVALFGAGGGTGTSLVGTTNIGSASADYLQIAGGTANTSLTATGSSTNIDITLTPKGTGILKSNGLQLSGLTASRALVTDASKNLTSSSVTSTELGYLAGVTSAIQTQLNSKQAQDFLLDDIADLTDPNADRIMFWDDSAGIMQWLTIGTGLSITDTTISSTGGGVPTQITVASEVVDETNYVLFVNDETGDLQPKTNPDFTFDANGILSVPRLTVTSSNFTIGSSLPFSDSAGTLTLQNVDAIDATTEATIESAIDTLANLTSIQGQTFTLAGAFITSGANSLTLTTTGATNVTLPTTGTLATLAGSETLTNKTLTSPVLNTGVSGTAVADVSTTNTGTSTTTIVTPDGLAGSYAGTKTLDIYVLDWDYLLTTGNGKAYIRIPSSMNGMNLVSASAAVGTASSSGTPTIQIARGRQSSATSAHSFVDMLSTRITIDATEYDSKDATTAAVINTSNDDIATGDIIRVDVDVTGTGTSGLLVSLEFRLP